MSSDWCAVKRCRMNPSPDTPPDCSDGSEGLIHVPYGGVVAEAEQGL